jgi:predicted Fe-Mo cluster-binding NifX family protein
MLISRQSISMADSNPKAVTNDCEPWKVAISATGNNLEAQVDPAFGRCKYFIIYDTDTKIHKAIPNQGSGMTGDAGSSAVQTIMEQGVAEILTGKVGLKSRPLLERAGITISENQTGTVAGILSTFKATPQPIKKERRYNFIRTSFKNYVPCSLILSNYR